MTLKTKLSLGLGFLFLIIFILIGFCSYYVGKLGQESDNILKDNYNSIVYANNMLSGYDEMKTSVSSIMHDANHAGRMSDYYRKLFESGKNLFESNLKEENNNITEINENQYTEKLNQDYAVFLKLCLQMENGGDGSSVFNDFLTASEKLKQSITSINDVNMQAVVRKSNLTKHDSVRFKNSMASDRHDMLHAGAGIFLVFPCLYLHDHQLSFGQNEKSAKDQRHYLGHTNKR